MNSQFSTTAETNEIDAGKQRVSGLAGLVGAAAFLFVLNTNDPSAQAYAQEASQAEAQHVDTAKEVEQRLAVYTLWLAIFTGVLAVSTVGLWWVTWRSGLRQSREMRQSVEVAVRSADAAMKAALATENTIEGIIGSERPWVLL
jgi:hypothetical protein